MEEQLFQDIFDKIQDDLPAEWNKVVFFAGYSDESYSMKFYSKDIGGGFIDCFSLPGITKAKLIKTFMDIDKILSKERNRLEGENKWTIFTMIVDAEGNVKTYFEYGDHSDDMISYEREWKKKYL